MESTASRDADVVMRGVVQSQTCIDRTEPGRIEVVLRVEHIGNEEDGIHLASVDATRRQRASNRCLDQLEDVRIVSRKQGGTVRRLAQPFAEGTICDSLLYWRRLSSRILDCAHIYMADHVRAVPLEGEGY